jgi:hypothetical protein
MDGVADARSRGFTVAAPAQKSNKLAQTAVTAARYRIDAIGLPPPEKAQINWRARE